MGIPRLAPFRFPVVVAAVMLPLSFSVWPAGTGLCWDVRVQAHVPCGSDPTAGTSVPQGAVSTPAPPAVDHEAEARRQREAAEAERMREMQRREAERRRFLSEKLEHLKGLKGADFDGSGGSGLKGIGAPAGKTAGLKQSGKSTSSPTLKSPRITKGTKYSAPVDIRTLEVIGGQAFRREAAWSAHILDSDWPLELKSSAALGLALAEQGKYDAAAWLLDPAARALPDDPVIAKALRQARELAEQSRTNTKNAGHLKGMSVDIDKAKRLPDAAQADLLLAAISARTGNYDAAEKALYRALKKADDNDLRQARELLQELSLAQKQAAAGNPELLWSEAVSLRASGQAAWKLGMHLPDHGKHEAAVKLLQEARAALTDRNDQKLLGQMIENVHDLAKSAQSPFRSRTDALLDALEYGNGNANRSLEYLRIAHEANRQDSAVRDALNYLEGLNASGVLAKE